MGLFKLVSDFKVCGDQPQAIESMVRGYKKGLKSQLLLGVTGSGKTFTMANIIAGLDMPVLVISHNKTLAAQLYSEFKSFFPYNAVEYFVSYYDYYQPEAYIPHTDTYISKDASINENLDKLRLSATGSILSRRDTIVVSSVSCIYGLGSPEDWADMLLSVRIGDDIDRGKFISSLVYLQYERNDYDICRGSFRVRGDAVDIFPAYSDTPVRVEFDGEEVTGIYILSEDFIPHIEVEKFVLYPAKHFVVTRPKLEEAIKSIREELKERVKYFVENGKYIEAKRLENRTLYDIEMLREVGYCSGIENYSRHLAGRPPGSRPYSLIDYFQGDFLIIIDESHVTIPQIKGMYNGDRARKEVLVEHGFRLPSALDNRPLSFEEYESLERYVLYVSATPKEYEREKAENIAEQLIRPTGILDPEIDVRPSRNVAKDIIAEVSKRAARDERVLITTLTKKMAENLSDYLIKNGIKVTYIHSELDAFERVGVLNSLRMKKIDAVVGVNLLREGLDLPEVSLVIIVDADKEGFLRSEISLIQLAGRAARNENGMVIMYADKVTSSMKAAIRETARRRKKQMEYNRKHGIVPRSIRNVIKEGIVKREEANKYACEIANVSEDEEAVNKYISFLVEKMEEAARVLDFDKAIRYRDKIKSIKPGFFKV